MSRIGKMPIHLPEGVSVEVNGTEIAVSGKLGKLTRTVDTCVKIEKNENELVLTRESEDKEVKAKHGLYRALINNMVHGVSEGYTKELLVKGVGYRLQKQGNKLVMNIGFSKPVEVVEPEGIKIEAPEADKIAVSGIDKELVGQVAAKIRAIKPVEPYHLYGIRYVDEVVVQKEGKKVAAKK
ncbi:MAG: 50S ribosomal protein L6 [Clostridiales bacterium]|nr:50S ribosomal protein L6 [Candidatus Apopatousia equi]